MRLFHFALFGFFAICIMSSLADHSFKNCSLLEKSLIQGSVRHAQLLITFARVDGSSEFIGNTDLSESSQELIETHQRWRADIYKTIAMELPQIIFICTTDITSIETMCNAAPNDTPQPAENSLPLFVKTDTGNFALCRNRTPQDQHFAALQVAHELIEMAKKMESDKRAEVVVQNLAAIDKRTQQIIEDVCNLLLSLDDYYVTDFWKRTMNWYSKTIGHIAAMLT